MHDFSRAGHVILGCPRLLYLRTSTFVQSLHNLCLGVERHLWYGHRLRGGAQHEYCNSNSPVYYTQMLFSFYSDKWKICLQISNLLDKPTFPLSKFINPGGMQIRYKYGGYGEHPAFSPNKSLTYAGYMPKRSPWAVLSLISANLSLCAFFALVQLLCLVAK